MKKYYLAIGYPLTYAVDKPSVYILEQIDGTIALTTEELKEWTSFLRVNVREQETELLRSLIRKGAVVSANSLEELLEQIRRCNVIRQGFGFLNQKKYCIMVGKECWYPTRGQLILWSGADGVNTVDGLMKLGAGENLTEMQVFNGISILMQNDSLFLR